MSGVESGAIVEKNQDAHAGIHFIFSYFLFLILLEAALLTCWVQLSVSQLSVEVVASGEELIFHIAL